MPSQDDSLTKDANIASSNTQPAWITQAEKVQAAEKRWQPWKETLQNVKINEGFDGQDKVHTRCDDDVQHSSVAG